MNILGMFGPGENPSASLLINGKLIALIEEERINRIKTSPNNLPILSAKECLKIAGISINEIDAIAWGWDCPKYFSYIKKIKNKNKKDFNILQNELNKNLYHPQRIKRAVELGFSDQCKKKNAQNSFFNSSFVSCSFNFFLFRL